MDYKYLDIKDLNQKRYQKNRKSKFYWQIILIILSLSVLGTISWMCLGEIDVIIKTNGVIKNKANISYIYSIKEGYIKYIIPSKTNKVQEDDLLLALNSERLKEQMNYIENKIISLNNKINDLELFYGHLKQRKLAKEINNPVVKNEFRNTVDKIEHLQDKINIQIERYERLLPFKGLSITENKLQQEDNKIDKLKYDLKDYKNKKLLSIRKRIKTFEDKILTKKIELAKLEDNLKHYKIYAPIDGHLEYLNKYNNGDYIPSGVQIMKIVPFLTEKFQVDLFIKDKDILKLSKGDLVRFKIASYPYKEYGVAEGRILKINNDTSSNNEENYGYKVVASINNYIEKGKNITKIKYKNGMLTNASIVIRKRKIIYYILEKLDFLNSGVF